VAQNAQRTDASQRNQNLQLSDTAHVYTRPQLEIYADDVRCNHGATIGRLDDEAIYYMRQRGISEAEARRMQLHGFADEIVNHCPSETLRETIGKKISGLIDRF
jgi:Fe-S cluster assembly protein SufD